MDKITDEMRTKLREPLPPEAVSQHPTKTYLSSIKSIYVVERINEVFGLGSWTLKSEVMERLEKFVVVKAILEIPGVGFYGEAYGGNDNADIGDAYKGATTDGLTKVAAQQLEIGIDVFKGVKSKPQATKSKSSPVKEKSSSEHWCKEHNTEFFMRGKMRSYGHPIEGTDPVEWCREHIEKDVEGLFPPDPKHAAEAAEAAQEAAAQREAEAPGEEPKELKRDPSTIKTITDLYKACNEDFTIPDKDGKPQKMQPQTVIKELGVGSPSEISDTPEECYRKIAAVR